MTEHKVLSFDELKDFPNAKEARQTLQKLIVATAKVMVNRKWRVKSLKEFYPDEKGLLGLNVNHGTVIKVRLRSPENRNEFLPWESVLGTMIHELTHNQINAHSAEFYQLMDKVYDEVESTSSEIPQQMSFVGVSQKLGGANVKAADSKRLRELAAAAAVKREQRYAAYKGGGGCALGGAHVVNGSSSGGASLSASELRRRMADSALSRMQSSKLPIASSSTPITGINNNSSSSTVKSQPVGSRQEQCYEEADSIFASWSCSLCLEPNTALALSCSFCGSLPCKRTASDSAVAQGDTNHQYASKRSKLIDMTTNSNGSSNAESRDSAAQTSSRSAENRDSAVQTADLLVIGKERQRRGRSDFSSRENALCIECLPVSGSGVNNSSAACCSFCAADS